jgi:hypothetical protein
VPNGLPYNRVGYRSEKDAPMGYFVSGGGVAASPQFGGNQTDRFSVDNGGRLNVSWVDNAGP